jgi:Delta7-sterol 5-desaturase
VHRHHHKFYNPTPFAVIADELLDQFVRSLPLCVLPWMMPLDMDLLFGIFAIFFYGYGVYLHYGYESPMLSAHQPMLNTSYHHYTHHAISAMGRPIYTGFFVKIWDHIFGSTNPNACSCVECRPRRTEKEWEKTLKPDYSVLLSPSWWMSSGSKPVEDKDGKGL